MVFTFIDTLFFAFLKVCFILLHILLWLVIAVYTSNSDRLMRLEASPFHTPVLSRVAGDAGRATAIESTDPSEVVPRKTDMGRI